MLVSWKRRILGKREYVEYRGYRITSDGKNMLVRCDDGRIRSVNCEIEDVCWHNKERISG